MSRLWEVIESRAPESLRSSISVENEQSKGGLFDKALNKANRKKRKKKDRHKRVKVAFFRYCYYDPAFRYFIEKVLDADYLALPEPTKRTAEIGVQNSTDYVCTPFKHILGDYVDALENGADILVQFGGPCRLGYYGELHENILRDMGYTDFKILNFSKSAELGAPLSWAKECLQVVNPNLSIKDGVKELVALASMVEKLDGARDCYLANAGFETEKGSFDRAWNVYMDEMRAARDAHDINAAYNKVMETMADLPTDKPDNPIRIGVVGEMFTAIDERSNLDLDKKLMSMGVEVHRMMNLTNRFIHYNEPNLRKGASDYIDYDMGPTSTITVVAARKYADEGFDGVVHAKSSGCTPEIDCEPVLQRISSDFKMPILYLTYDSQTSDTGLDTRLEAFYDMLAMKKEKMK